MVNITTQTVSITWNTVNVIGSHIIVPGHKTGSWSQAGWAQEEGERLVIQNMVHTTHETP